MFKKHFENVHNFIEFKISSYNLSIKNVRELTDYAMQQCVQKTEINNIRYFIM